MQSQQGYKNDLNKLKMTDSQQQFQRKLAELDNVAIKSPSKDCVCPQVTATPVQSIPVASVEAIVDRSVDKVVKKLDENEVSRNSLEFFARNINKHHVMLFFGIFFFLIGVIGYFIISGAQLGSCNTEYSGAFVKSSTSNDNDNSEINTTTEIVAELFCVLFLLIGTILVVYAMTLMKTNDLLQRYKQFKAILILNKSNETDSKVMKEAEIAQIVEQIKNDPPSFKRLIKMSVESKEKNAAYLNQKYGSIQTADDSDDDIY